jgi:O-methyltransferase
MSEQVSSEELKTILNNLELSLHKNPAGSILEFGCYVGTTSITISRYIDITGRNNSFHVYDSFEGLPKKDSKDESPAGLNFVEGELSVSKKEFINVYKKAGLNLPIIHKAWFSDLTEEEIPDNIAFAFLDGDYYNSIKDSLDLISDKLAQGSVIVIDDYQSESLPGAKKATDEWLSRKSRQHKLVRVENSLAIICDGRAYY